MKINELSLSNYRTFDSQIVALPTYYSAICGKNNAGKTNFVRAIRAILSERRPFDQNDGILHKRDYPNWKSKKDGGPIRVQLTISVHKQVDDGLFRFIQKFANLPETADEALNVQLALSATEEKVTEEVRVNGAAMDDFSASEILRKFRSSNTIIFHNSVGSDDNYPFYGRSQVVLGDTSPADRDVFEASQQKLNNIVMKMAKRHQREVADLLGKLGEKYQVGLSAPKLDFDLLPFHMSLGYTDKSVDFEDWGSGTQNRVRILLALLRAKRIVESEEISDKITPVIVIEEPESFLHHSAQAVFGSLLKDLAEEFRVQVLATTHSPFMLSNSSPDSNILLERHREKAVPRHSVVVPTGGEDWMKPFALALGTSNDVFRSWHNLFFAPGGGLLLVEGDTDKAYFEMLRDPQHGDKGLKFTGEIFAYGGKDAIKNQVLLRYLKSKHDKLFITYDLDCDREMQKLFTTIGLKLGSHFGAVGKDAPGKRDIEGLLPDRIRCLVYGENPDVVAQASSGDTQERNSGRSRMKQLLLDAFRAEAKPGPDFADFYSLCRIVNRALS